MFSKPTSLATGPCNSCLGQVRTFRKRMAARPLKYKPELAPLSHPQKDHSGFLPRHLKAWMGPKNIRGEYYRNKYYYPPQDNTPKYIVPDGITLQDQKSFGKPFGTMGHNPALHPFHNNLHCKTASIISDDLKQTIYSEVVEKSMHTQEVAHKYGIKLARVEAIVRLQKIERSWREEVCYFEHGEMMRLQKIRLVLKTT